MTDDRMLIVVPCHMGSTRLIEKPLLEVDGKHLFEHTYYRAKESGCDVVIAGDSVKLARIAESKNVPFVRTGPCISGTQRCYRAWQAMPDAAKYSIIVNWQVDEPEVRASTVLDMAALVKSPDRIITLARTLSPTDMNNPSVVKAVVDYRGICRWFSRQWLEESFHHVGIYVFGSTALRKASDMPPTRHSRSAKLEQLTWIERGLEVRAHCVSERAPLSINTQIDYLQWQSTKKR